MIRVALLVFALALCACKPHPGASIHADQARSAVIEINQALHNAQTLHASGAVYDARDQWSSAKITYNKKLEEGVAYHCSSGQALKLSYLLAKVARELNAPKGKPQVAMNTLSSELETTLSEIPHPPARQD